MTEFPAFLIQSLRETEAQEFAALSSNQRTAYIKFLAHFLGKPPEFEDWVVFWNKANLDKAHCMSKFHTEIEANTLKLADVNSKQ